jgi:gas vesicle protein
MQLLEGYDMSAKGYWFAFGLGITAGAAVALLYAPQPGVKTRRQLKKGIDEGVDYLEEAAEYLKEQTESFRKEALKALDRTRGHVEDAVDKGSDAVSGAFKSVRSII